LEIVEGDREVDSFVMRTNKNYKVIIYRLQVFIELFDANIALTQSPKKNSLKECVFC